MRNMMERFSIDCKTNSVSFARVFPRLEPVNYMFASNSDCFVALFTSLTSARVINFDFGFTTHK